jgi:DNA-binding response OmpR family regulator
VRSQYQRDNFRPVASARAMPLFITLLRSWLKRSQGEQDHPRRLVTVRGYGYKLITKP